MLVEMLLVGLQFTQCPLIVANIDSFLIYEVGDKEVMSCFQILTLQEKYGDYLEEMVPLNQSVITYDELRYLNVLHVGYDGCVHVGELVVNVQVADEVLEIFKQLYQIRYPIEKMHVMSYYHGSDELSM